MKTKHFIIAFFTLVLAVINANANNMLVQNVTTLNDNPTAKTVQVQFDLSWDNSWRDSINWDAAWIFLKFKDSNGLWQHVKLNTNGFQNGSGTSNTVQVSSDNIGAWVYRDSRGSGTFNSTTMQLQWNYGLSGLSKVTGLEVRVFAVEMVYVPEGEFNVAKGFYNITEMCCGSHNFNGSFNAPGSNFPVINNRLSPTLDYSDGTSAKVRIKGDAGIDTNNDGVIDNTNYPIGYRAFYCFKYELTNQQYADFLNTLTSNQITTLGVAGSGITLTNGQYFASAPNTACGNSNETRLFAYADWSGIRPMSILEFNKATYGPLQPVFSGNIPRIRGYIAGGAITNYNLSPYAINLTNVGSFAKINSTRATSGSTFYGCLDFTGNTAEPIIKLNSYNFTSVNGDGNISTIGYSDVLTWQNGMIIFADQIGENRFGSQYFGFRYVRSAE